MSHLFSCLARNIEFYRFCVLCLVMPSASNMLITRFQIIPTGRKPPKSFFQIFLLSLNTLTQDKHTNPAGSLDICADFGDPEELSFICMEVLCLHAYSRTLPIHSDSLAAKFLLPATAFRAILKGRERLRKGYCVSTQSLHSYCLVACRSPVLSSVARGQCQSLSTPHSHPTSPPY